MKLLVIEDDTGLNRGISFALEQEGYEVAGARTLREGYRLFEREAPAAVILDLNLPDGDGVEFCRRIRSAPGTGAGSYTRDRPLSIPDALAGMNMEVLVEGRLRGQPFLIDMEE